MSELANRPCMEDIHAAVVAAMNKLDALGVIDSEDRKHDLLFLELSATIERYFNYPDYANYN